MTGWLGVGRSMNWTVSLWPPGRSMCTGFVREVTLPSTCPSRALVEIYDGSLSGRSPSRRARDRSMMLSSAPESTRAAMGWEPEGSRSSPERVGLLGEADSTTELTSMPLVTGELSFNGHRSAKCPGWPQHRQRFCLRLLSFSSGGRWVRPTCMGSGSPQVSGMEAGVTGNLGRGGLRGGASEHVSLLRAWI